MSLSWVIFGVIVLMTGYLIKTFNKLVFCRQKRRQAFSDIDVQLKQRFDLIPQLIETVKGYVSHEKEVLKELTEARVGVEQAGNSVPQRAAAENKLSQAMIGLFAVAENYPDLKASENFGQLMDQLSIVEDKIAAARRFFNSATENLNTAVEQFPASLIAKSFGFHQEPFFEVDTVTKEAMQDPVQVKF